MKVRGKKGRNKEENIERQTQAVSYLSISYVEVQHRSSTIIDLFKRDGQRVAFYFHFIKQQMWTVWFTYRQEAERTFNQFSSFDYDIYFYGLHTD